MSQNYPFNTPLTPQEWYCRADNTICVKSWAGFLVVEYVPGAHVRIQRLFQRIAMLYNQLQIPYMFTDYDANGALVAHGMNIYIRAAVLNGVVLTDLGLPAAPGSDVAVRQIVFHILPYRKDVREIIDTV